MSKKFPQLFQLEKGLFSHSLIIQEKLYRMCTCVCAYMLIMCMFLLANFLKNFTERTHDPFML